MSALPQESAILHDCRASRPWFDRSNPRRKNVCCRKLRPPSMDTVILESVSKFFRHRPALWNWFGAERRGVTRAVSQVSLRAAEGDVLVILGPNGSGKTTLLKLVSTMLLPDEGRVLVCNTDTADHPRRARRHVGFAVASERSFFPRLTARENLDFFAALEE